MEYVCCDPVYGVRWAAGRTLEASVDASFVVDVTFVRESPGDFGNRRFLFRLQPLCEVTSWATTKCHVDEWGASTDLYALWSQSQDYGIPTGCMSMDCDTTLFTDKECARKIHSRCKIDHQTRNTGLYIYTTAIELHFPHVLEFKAHRQRGRAFADGAQNVNKISAQ